MPNLSGIWTPVQQFQARGQNIWPKPPDAPTIGTATAGLSKCASVTFTAPTCTGLFPAGITNYTVTSTPGCLTNTGASSPIVISCLTIGTSYTFKVKATGDNGTGPCSNASNSITATVATCATYTSPGTYSWIPPAGVTSAAILAVGAGAGASYYVGGTSGFAGGGGGLGYKNNQSLTAGLSYTIVVGAGSASLKTTSGTVANGGDSYFSHPTLGQLVKGGGGKGGTFPCSSYKFGCGGTYTGTGGGNGGNGSAQIPTLPYRYGGGGAGGYGGPGGNGGQTFCNGSSGSLGGGGGGAGFKTSVFGYDSATSGGGVGLYGRGSSGSGGSGVNSCCSNPNITGGGGGSGGTAGATVNLNVANSPPSPGVYGGGVGPGKSATTAVSGGKGAVRIVWCVCGVRGTPSFPTTNVGPS
jgi:hypothetical protein